MIKNFPYKDKFTHKKFYVIAPGTEIFSLSLIYSYVRFRMKLSDLENMQ